MEKAIKISSSEKEFQSYILQQICQYGGTRMQVTISDLTNFMQKLDPKDNINLFRKAYGNTEQCLKAIKHSIFILDSMIVKLLPFEKMNDMANKGVISKSDWDLYKKTFDENELKNQQTLKINRQNKCKVNIIPIKILIVI